MFLPNAAHQTGLHRSFRADGTLSGSAAQLVLPVALSRSMLMIMNCSSNAMYLEHGPARATATITTGTVTSVTITNAGFGYTYPPIVEFVGGYGDPAFVASSTWNGLGLIGSPSPQGVRVQGLSAGPIHARIAKGLAVLSGGAIASITITDLGAGYINPPEILLTNDPRDPFGCAVPVAGTSIILNASGGAYYINGSACHTDQIALIGTSTNAYAVEYML